MKKVRCLNFACEEGKITRWWLVLRLPSNSLCHREVVANLEEYESDILDEILSQLNAELQKENGDDYEPDFLKRVS